MNRESLPFRGRNTELLDAAMEIGKCLNGAPNCEFSACKDIADFIEQTVVRQEELCISDYDTYSRFYPEGYKPTDNGNRLYEIARLNASLLVLDLRNVPHIGNEQKLTVRKFLLECSQYTTAAEYRKASSGRVPF